MLGAYSCGKSVVVPPSTLFTWREKAKRGKVSDLVARCSCQVRWEDLVSQSGDLNLATVSVLSRLDEVFVEALGRLQGGVGERIQVTVAS